MGSNAAGRRGFGELQGVLRAKKWGLEIADLKFGMDGIAGTPSSGLTATFSPARGEGRLCLFPRPVGERTPNGSGLFDVSLVCRERQTVAGTGNGF